MDYFENLAKIVSAKWSAHEYDWAAFSDIAAASLTELPVNEHLDVNKLTDCYFSCEQGRFPMQNHPSPQIIAAYANSKFHIMVHLWADLLATPHQHGWPGAFQVWYGKPLHAVYEFTETQRINHVLQLGRLQLKRLEQLKPGDAMPIQVGPDYIHGLSHVQRPSLSISIRSNHTDNRMTKDYWRDGLAVVTGYQDTEATLKARYRWLDFLCTSGQDDEYLSRICKLIVEGDNTTVFFVLQHVNRNLPDEVENILERCRERYGDSEFFTSMVTSLADMDRADVFTGARQSIHNEELRLLLGVLYFAENRQKVISVLKDITGVDDVEQKVNDWSLQLFKFSVDEQGGKQKEGLDEIYKALADGPASFEQFITRLKTVFDDQNIESQASLLKGLYARHRQSPILAPLFECE